VELEHHDLLLAEGLACESYLDTGNRGAFANGGGAVMMHPDFALKVWERDSCARLVITGAELEAARSWLLERAEMLGHVLTRDADLQVWVAGSVLWPSVAGTTYRLALPADARSIRLVSRSSVPAHVQDDSNDHRRLGVAISKVILAGEPIALTDARLGSGWHAIEGVEAAAPWRWTDGEAELMLDGGGILSIEVMMTGRYWHEARSYRAAGAAGGDGRSPDVRLIALTYR